MKLSLIVAMAKNRVIGVDNRLPWHLPADLKYFRRITMGKPILMGRKTFDSIGRPLPGRHNVVVTRNRDYRQDGCSIFNSIGDALGALSNEEEVMVIGGASFYEALLPMADRLYLTQIHREYHGDTFFPEYDASQWRESQRTDVEDDADASFSYSFITLDRP